MSFVLILLLWLLTLLGRVHALSLSAVSATPTEISTSAAYSVTFSFSSTQTGPLDIIVEFTFPSASYPTIPDGSIAGWTMNPLPSSVTCTGDNASKTVSFDFNLPASNTLNSILVASIPGITNPSTTAAVSTFASVLRNKATNAVLESWTTCGATFTPTPKALTSASISLASGFTNTVGATIDILLQVEYSSAIEANSVIVVSFPKWETDSLGAMTPVSCLSSSVTWQNEADSSSLTCTYTTGSGSTNDDLTISGLITTPKSAGDTNTVRIRNFMNYLQIATYSVDVNVNSAGGNTINSFSGISMAPTDPATLIQGSISLSSSTVNAQTSYFFTVRISSILPIGAFMRITLPTEVSYQDSTGTDILSSAADFNSLNTPTIVKTGLTSTPSYFDLTGMVTTSANYQTKNSAILIQIFNLRNPPSVATSGSFSIGLYDSSNNLYEQQTSGITLTSTAGPLLEISGTSALSATSTTVLDSVDFTITLQTTTAVDPGASASIVVVFPSEFTLTAGSCTLSALTGFSSSTCAISGQTVTISNFATDTLSASENFAFTIGSNKITLPSSTATTSAFTISTQLSGSNVDTITTLTWSQTTAGTLGLPSPTTDAITVASSVTYVTTTYTFKMLPPKTIEQNAVVRMTFPSEITPPTTPTCTGVSNIQTTLTWTVSGSVLSISNGYSTAAQAFTGSEVLSFTVASVRNPRSLATTSAFLFEVQSSGGNAIYSVNSPTLTLTTAATFSSVTITPGSGVNGASTTYTWAFTTSSQLAVGDLFKITPPSTVTVSSPIWTGVTNLASSLTCSVSSGILEVTVSFVRRNLANGNPGTYSFTTSGIQNGPSTAPSGTFTLQTVSSGGVNLIEQSTTQTVTNTQAGIITTASASVDSVSLSTAVTYTLTFTPVNYVQGMSLRITLPSTLSISDGTNTWTNVQGLSSATFSCTYTSASRQILVENQFVGATNPGQVSLQLPSITNPATYGTTSSFIISTFETVGGTEYTIDQITSGITVAVTWDSTCLTCSSIATSWLTWNTTSSNKYLLNNACLTVCPDSFYANVDQWSSWDTTCLTWSGSSTTCTSCSAERALYNSQCLTECPTGFSKSGTTWVENSGSTSEGIIPFPFLIVCCIIIFGVFLLKLAKKDTRLLPSSVALIWFVELLAWIYLAYLLLDKSYKVSFGIVSLALLGIFFSNIVFLIVCCWNKWKQNWWIITISCIVCFRFYRFSYSYFAGSKILARKSPLSVATLIILSTLSIWISSCPILWATIYNLFYTNKNEKVWWTDIEVIVITSISIILMALEMMNLSSYKNPSDEKDFCDIEEANNSKNDLMNKSQLSNRSENSSRKFVAKKSLKDLEGEEEKVEIFGEKLSDGGNNPKPRYSIQDEKDSLALDEDVSNQLRKIDSEPDMNKDKNLNSDKSNEKIQGVLVDPRKDKKKSPKEEKKDSQCDPSIHDENDQTDDKPSEIEKKLNDSENESHKLLEENQDQGTNPKALPSQNLDKNEKDKQAILNKTDKQKSVSEEEKDPQKMNKEVVPHPSTKNPDDQSPEEKDNSEDEPNCLPNNEEAKKGKEDLPPNTHVQEDKSVKLLNDEDSDIEKDLKKEETDENQTNSEANAKDSKEKGWEGNKDEKEGKGGYEDEEKGKNRNEDEEKNHQLVKDDVPVPLPEDPSTNEEGKQTPTDANKSGPLLNEDDSRNGDLTEEKANGEGEKALGSKAKNNEEEKAVGLDELENDSGNLNPSHELEDESQNFDENRKNVLKRTVSEKEQPLDEVIWRENESMQTPLSSKIVQSENGDRIIHASEGRGSKETTNGVLETPPPEESEELDAEVIEEETKKGPRIFYSDRSESSIESMMADTPSNYNILNGRLDDKGKQTMGLLSKGLMENPNRGHDRRKTNMKKAELDIISEIEGPHSKAPSNLENIKYVKTTKNERQFVDSVVGSDKNSYKGDMIAGSLNNRPNPYGNSLAHLTQDLRSKSKSNLKQKFPRRKLEESKTSHRDLKYNQFMVSNQGSEINSALDGYDENSHRQSKNLISGSEIRKEIASGLPSVRYQNMKTKSTKNANS